MTVLTLFGLLLIDFVTGRAIYFVPDDPNALKVKITGHQWWWEVQYGAPQPSDIVTTANELHVPTGRTVRLELNSVDVIHSFWAPNLHGKKDLIPGQPTVTSIMANREGKFRAQCAEYCGQQHAHMRLVVTAENPAAFEQWLIAQRQSSQSPQTDTQKARPAIYSLARNASCVTPSRARKRGRRSALISPISAAANGLPPALFPNSPGNLAKWIMNPQEFKPGVRMPANEFAPDALNALVDYLESLK